MGRTKKTADQKEYEKLTAEKTDLTKKYNAEKNFIQKNNIHLQLQKVNRSLNELEGKQSTSSFNSQRGNYQSALK